MNAASKQKMEWITAGANRCVEVQGVERMHVVDVIRMFGKAGQPITLTPAEFAEVLTVGGLDVRGLWVYAQ